MPRGDYRRKESKKPKKDKRKIAPSLISLAPAPEPELATRRRNPKRSEEEEES